MINRQLTIELVELKTELIPEMERGKVYLSVGSDKNSVRYLYFLCPCNDQSRHNGAEFITIPVCVDNTVVGKTKCWKLVSLEPFTITPSLLIKDGAPNECHFFFTDGEVQWCC